MDRYAEMMLHDDMSSTEEITIICPSCETKIYAKLSDQFAKCIRCGEQFYLENIEEEA